VLAEMTLRSLEPGSDADHRDFLARAEILAALGVDVLISRFEPYYELAEYLAAYTDKPIGLAVGMPTIRQIADERYYTDLPGGVLESAGRLFKRSVTMYVYPTRDPASGDIVSVERAPIPAPWHHLRNLLLDIGRVEPIRGYDETLLTIQTPDVLRKIESEIRPGRRWFRGPRRTSSRPHLFHMILHRCRTMPPSRHEDTDTDFLCCH
jgi:hypothetical protein